MVVPAGDEVTEASHEVCPIVASDGGDSHACQVGTTQNCVDVGTDLLCSVARVTKGDAKTAAKEFPVCDEVT